MRLPYRSIALGVVAIAFSALLFQRAQAGGSHYFAPVTDPVVKEECGSCHLAFPPSMLPAGSWQRMMGDLKNHFGDDASVDAATAAHITDYLVANAGDTGGRRYGDKLLRGTSTTNAPLRITELSRWLREHREVSAREWQHKDVRSKANCVACHAAAERGYYDD
ncbi:diheme cytochrome c [Candidatus Accumulibacter sp. ACC003]|uniref:diheme cytochrome c n=1 Tax=Candidatus Accumulibacter sp. ACC003 TaxID=2823334 RepID=UPI0025C473C7|nr:diheme cytochrome c [Candidatus Accumulibacter sp. ACC003]